ncbi:hypothetical protein [Streptomyces turgidiscabies]|uniref:hypothetical protein n=1 Tax=Streptomyces turgidiscabies TaxID=85558 RepID=UPI0038F6CDC3
MAAPATPQQLASLVQDTQAAEAAALEEATVEEADGGTGARLAALAAVVLAAWVAAFGALTAAGTGVRLAQLLAGVRADVDRASRGLDARSQHALERALDGATRMGARHAATFLTRATGRLHTAPAVTVSADAARAAWGLAGSVREQLRMAARLLSPRMVSGSGWRGVLTGLGAARRAAALVRQTVTWAIHRAINDGTAQTANHYSARLLWIAETDACVTCLAYAGRLSDRDGQFPGGLSMDPNARSTTRASLDGPPAHINCRCRAVPWLPGWGAGSGSLPDLLREQAWHSIATGRGRPSESHAARRRAAQALLAQRGLSARVRRQAQATAAGRS